MADERWVSPVHTTSADPDEAYRLFAPIRDQYIRDMRAAESRGRTAGYAEAVQALRDQAASSFDGTRAHTFWTNAASYLENRAAALAASTPSATTEEPTRHDPA